MSDSATIMRLRAAELRISKAKDAYDNLIRGVLRDGQVVHYMHGGRWRAARVRDKGGRGPCGTGGRVWVEAVTGRCYWLHVYRIEEIGE